MHDQYACLHILYIYIHTFLHSQQYLFPVQKKQTNTYPYPKKKNTHTSCAQVTFKCRDIFKSRHLYAKTNKYIPIHTKNTHTSCAQVTFQCRDIFESRHLYDQLAVLTPIMLSLTAATPVLKCVHQLSVCLGFMRFFLVCLRIILLGICACFDGSLVHISIKFLHMF